MSRTLRELTGFTTMVFELIQNADDTQTGTCLRFDVRKEALWVEDDGGFTDCERQDLGVQSCPFLDEFGHRCDFHSFRLFSGADKRLRENTTGAMGIGFTSVYQVTDRPELISGRLHWVIDETKQQNERIVETELETPHQGTRFVLPWAKDPSSDFRIRAAVAPAPADVDEQVLAALDEAVAPAMLFLRNLDRIEILRNGSLVRYVTRVPEGDQLLIDDNGTLQEWHLFRGDFDAQASRLRDEHPGQIEEFRSSKVAVAVPVDFEVDGRLCATLPTAFLTKLPLHINAELFLTSDRRQPLMSTAASSRWNAEAIACAARVIADHLEALAELLGPVRLWGALDQAWTLHRTGSGDPLAKALEAIWDKINPELKVCRIVWTSDDEWASIEESRLVLSVDEEVALEVLDALGIAMVHPDLRARFNVLQHVGVAVLSVADIAHAVARLEIVSGASLAALPEPLDNPSAREALWAQLGRLVSRLSNTQLAVVCGDFGGIPLVPTRAQTLAAVDVTRRADEQTAELFDPVLAHPLLDVKRLAGDAEPFASVCCPLTVDSGVAALEGLDRAVTADEAFALIEWFSKRELTAAQGDSLATLAMFPASDLATCPLTELTLPGAFPDVLSLARLVHPRAAKRFGPFLESLGARTLSLWVYVEDHAIPALDRDDLLVDQRREIVALLAQRWGEMSDIGTLRRLVTETAVVECTDGSWMVPTEAYFSSQQVARVLGGTAAIAVVSGAHSHALEQFLGDVGVADQPRRHDVLARIDALARADADAANRTGIEHIIDWLGTRWATIPDAQRAGWSKLQTSAWLPKRGSKDWHRSDELDLVFQEAAFRSQGSFLDVSRALQQRHSLLLAWLGCSSTPTTQKVVDHLLHCLRADEQPSDAVYTELNNRSEAPEIDALLGTSCLRLAGDWRRPDEVFWGDHPFGRWRVTLGPNFANAQKLLDRLGVRPAPTPADAITVLEDIASELGPTHDELDEEDQKVVLRSWRMCERALLDEEIAPDDLARLGSKETVVDERGILIKPGLLFFEDISGLADEFPTLRQSVIRRPDGAARAMSAAGVRDLSQVATARIVDVGDRIDSAFLTDLLTDRAEELARLVSDAGGESWTDVAERLDAVRWSAVTGLVVGWELELFGQHETGAPRPAAALWADDEKTLFVMVDGAGPSWNAVGREMIRAAWSESPAANLALAIAGVLRAPDRATAKRDLDDAGVPNLAAEVQAEVAAATASDFDTTAHDPVASEDETPVETGETVSGEDSTDVDGSDAPEDIDHQAGTGDRPGNTPDGELRQRRGGAAADASSGRTRGDGDGAAGGTTSSATERGKQSTSSESRLRSYVVPSLRDGESPKEPKEQDDRNVAVDAAGIAEVLSYERMHGREPEEMDHSNPGYDVRSFYDDGELARWIEVKSTAGAWDIKGVGLSPTQFRFAQRDGGDQCWLYVVEFALDVERRRVWCIHDPAERVSDFMFDDGWKGLAEPPGGTAHADSVKAT